MAKKKKKTKKNIANSAEKTKVILHCIIMAICFLIMSYALLAFAFMEDPEKASLKYENCTFVSYTFVDEDRTYYNIYVEEYNIPLEIDNIIYERTNVTALKKLEKGDIVTVSLRQFKDTRDIYEMYSGDSYIIKYEDYLELHGEQADGMIKISLVIMIISAGMIVTEILHFKKKGNALPWPSKFYIN